MNTSLKQALWLLVLFFTSIGIQVKAQTVEFLRMDNSLITDLNEVYNGGNGQNIQIKVRVTYPSDATNKKMKLTLGNFLSLLDDGTSDENTNLFINGITPNIKQN